MNAQHYNKEMKKTVFVLYKIIRSLLVTTLLLLVVIYSGIYIFLSLPSAQNRIRQIAERELTALLDAPVTIGKVSFSPISEVVIYDVCLPDKSGKHLAGIDKLGARISLKSLIIDRSIVFDYAEIIGLNAHISKATPDSPTNIQFLIDAFKPKKPNQEPKKFQLAFEAVVLRQCQASFDIESEPAKADSCLFDKNHIAVSQINADILIPNISNDNYEFNIKRFAAKEKSGLEISNLSLTAGIHPTELVLSNLKLELPNSILTPEDIRVQYADLKKIGQELDRLNLSFRMGNSYITPADFQAFVPALKLLDSPFYITCAISGNTSQLELETFDLQSEKSLLTLQTSGTVYHLTEADSMRIDVPNINLTANLHEIAALLRKNGTTKAGVTKLIGDIQYLTLNGTLKTDLKKFNYIGNINSGLGLIYLNGVYSFDKEKNFRQYSGQIKSNRLNLNKIAANNLLGEAAFNIQLKCSAYGKKLRGKMEGDIRHLDFKGYRYKKIETDVVFDNNSVEGVVALNDPNGQLSVSGLAKLDGVNTVMDIDVLVADACLDKLNLDSKHPDHKLNARLEASFTGNNPDNMEGDIIISDIRYTDADNNGLHLDHFDISSREKDGGKYMTVNTDFLNGHIDGHINFARIVPTMKNILSTAFPSLMAELPDENTANKHKKSAEPEPAQGENVFNFSFTASENNELTEFFRLPIRVVHPININGSVNEAQKKANLGVAARYIMQGNKVIERTSLSVNIDGISDLCTMTATTQLDHKNGNITLILNGNAANDRLDTDIAWHYDRKKKFSGEISLSTLVKKTAPDSITASIDVNPTQFFVNDTAWQIEKAKINICNKRIELRDINVNRENQFIKANGFVSASHEDEVKLNLQDIDLGYIFETLKINHVTFSGNATGDFYASGALSGSPRLNTDNLFVSRFSYNQAVLGDADLKSYWDHENKGIVINADIHQYNGRETYVRGIVYPTRDSLSFHFRPDRMNVKILQPFMSAFSSDISGVASGEALLYGTFKDINMRGRLYAEDFRMKLDFTNVYYTVSDSVLLDPDIIVLPKATVRDDYGNTATLNGRILHKNFKEASFDFSFTDIHNLLGFNTTERQNPIWYGKVFASGSAFVRGRPGFVNLDINVAASPSSSFTFTLSDQQEASEYTFITFTDKRKEKEEAELEKATPEFLKKLNREQEQAANPSIFSMNLQADINPGIAITLVMDPNGGDKIRATGNGNLRLEYASDRDMKMFGSYTVEEGHYNFTLQDIIMRDFTIKQGGSISFHGDPMSANVDLSAAYSLNANLQDLDESFAQDKELNRTVVPVNALLNLSGIISQPSITFDLEFPTLTQDVYRKVRSIISTDDMMNRQIIYLLALSRFYTPEYMGNTNKNSELASVASSTISNQLSNILGQLSDKWTIAPNFHSDKGDFSDMEVELALSSRLLNNRLLLNGNFGYRDNAMNSNNFIGDFDIEYLLTKNGNIRLKAYNRYNDENYYVRNALTTQGVGVVFKYDFERLFRKPRKEKATAPADSLPVTTVPERSDSTPPDNKRKPVIPQ
jgi:hypothetical protein